MKANQDLPKIMLEDLDEALATMNEATGLGADRFGPRFVKSLPKRAGRNLWISSINARNRLCGPGRCTSHWYVCLLQRGKRRATSRTRKVFATEWCDAKAGFWDDVVRGSSPLQAALRRLVADELTQNTDNQEACTVLFDVESFYDSISLSLVARAGLKLAYPPVLLSLALLAYAGVRFLTAGCSGFSEGIVISNGVAAGCAQGNHAARLALYDILQKSHELHPSTTTAQWVDDLAQRTQAPPRWSAKRLRRRCSWYRIYKGASWRLLPNLLSLQPHRKSSNMSFLPLQETKYTSRKPVKPGIWDWMCQVQESRHVVPWPKDGSRLEDEREDVRGSAGGPRSKLPRDSGGRGLGRRKLMVPRRWVRRFHGSSKPGQERLKLHNAEVEAGV